MNGWVPILESFSEINEWLINTFGLHLLLATKIGIKIVAEAFAGAFIFNLRIIFIIFLYLISEVFNAQTLSCLTKKNNC